jgi:hypothetical protein
MGPSTLRLIVRQFSCHVRIVLTIQCLSSEFLLSVMATELGGCRPRAKKDGRRAEMQRKVKLFAFHRVSFTALGAFWRLWYSRNCHNA